MARPHRPQIAGGIYHVYARGNKRADIYRDDVDRMTYLHLLERVVVRQDWRCLSYCLMPNHVHLLLETPEPNLADGMRRLHGDYAHLFNERHGDVGHVFQGRYGSVTITTDEQLVVAVAYIAHNPVKADLAESAAGWAWSSHRAVVGAAPRPTWLDVGRLLELLGTWGGDPAATYRELVEARAGARGTTAITSLTNRGRGGPPPASATVVSVVR